MPKIKTKNKEIFLLIALEGSIFKKIKKVKFNSKPKEKNNNKTEKPKFITLNQEISKKIDK